MIDETRILKIGKDPQTPLSGNYEKLNTHLNNRKKGKYDMANRERKHELKVFLSDDENRILEAKMKATNQPSKSAAIRQLIVESMLYEIDYRELRNIDTQLARIGNNINQVAKRVNETRNIYQADIDEIKKELNEIWRLQESMLSRQPSPVR